MNVMENNIGFVKLFSAMKNSHCKLENGKTSFKTIPFVRGTFNIDVFQVSMLNTFVFFSIIIFNKTPATLCSRHYYGNIMTLQLQMSCKFNMPTMMVIFRRETIIIDYPNPHRIEN